MKKQSTLQNIIAMFAGTCLNILISFVTTPLITRLVLPEDYAQWSLFTSYSTVLYAIVMIGLDQAFIRFYYKDDSINYKRFLIFTSIKIPFFICVIFSLCSFSWIQKLGLFGYEGLLPYILTMINVIILIVNRISQLVLRMEQRGKAYSTLIVLNKIVFAVMAIGLITATQINNFIILTISSMVSQAVITIAAIWMTKKYWKFYDIQKDFCEIRIKDLMLYGIPFIWALLAGDIFNAADKWSLNILTNLHEVGVYSAAATIVALTSVVNTTFCLLWAPMAMEHYSKDPEETTFFVRANAYITIAMFGIGAAIIGFKDIIILFLGEEYRLSSTIVPFLLFNPIMTTISETTVYGINFKKKTMYHTVIMLISCGINVILNFVFVPIFSSKGAALATAISYTAFFVLRTFFANKVFPVKFELKRFSFITILFSIYAAINTFIEIPILHNIVMMLIFILLLLVIYRKYVCSLWQWLSKQVIKKFNKHTAA